MHRSTTVLRPGHGEKIAQDSVINHDNGFMYPEHIPRNMDYRYLLYTLRQQNLMVLNVAITYLH